MRVHKTRRPCRARLSLLLVAGALSFLASTRVFAEVLATPRDEIAAGILVGVIGEGPDPIPGIVWQVFRPLSDTRVLNPSGESRGDGVPEFSTLLSGSPVAVWAYQNGTEHDIALAEWSGSAWAPTFFLTTDAADDLDPAIVTEPNGTIHVVWWQPGASDRILLSTRQAGQTIWSQPTELPTGGRSARRPSAAFASGGLRIAYERACADITCAQEVVVAARDFEGNFTQEVIAQTSRTDRLDVQIHAESSKLWVEWKNEPDRLAHSRLDAAGWSVVGSTVLTSPSWLGVLDTRRTVRRLLLPQ